MRLRQICFVAHDLEKTLDQFCDLLQAEVCFRDPGVGHFGLANGLIEVGGDFLEVVSPTEESTTAGRYLDRMKGDSGYMLIFQCENAQIYREKAEELNIRQVWTTNLENGVIATHFHPKDIGGVIMSVDSMNNEKWKNKYSDWQWAGTDWMTSKVNDSFAIIGAEMSCVSPNELSRKWSSFLKLPLSKKSQHDVIKGEDFEIRFSKDSDKGLTYLSEIDIKINDEDKKEEIISKYKISGNLSLKLCGTKINLL